VSAGCRSTRAGPRAHPPTSGRSRHRVTGGGRSTGADETNAVFGLRRRSGGSSSTLWRSLPDPRRLLVAPINAGDCRRARGRIGRPLQAIQPPRRSDCGRRAVARSSHVFVGVSTRTNGEAAAQMLQRLSRSAYKTVIHTDCTAACNLNSASPRSTIRAAREPVMGGPPPAPVRLFTSSNRAPDEPSGGESSAARRPGLYGGAFPPNRRSRRPPWCLASERVDASELAKAEAPSCFSLNRAGSNSDERCDDERPTPDSVNHRAPAAATYATVRWRGRIRSGVRVGAPSLSGGTPTLIQKRWQMPRQLAPFAMPYSNEADHPAEHPLERTEIGRTPGNLSCGRTVSSACQPCRLFTRTFRVASMPTKPVAAVYAEVVKWTTKGPAARHC